ncbi:MAG: hypothetical protein M0Z77_11935 [Thermoplasmatales archaeon]|nr:hypothetical protein [Thermoplasmatales archaeon]
MEIITARIDWETKEKMKKLPHINWSNVIREAVIKKIQEEEAKEQIIDRNVLQEGLVIASMVRKSNKWWNSTEEIRKWRKQIT